MNVLYSETFPWNSGGSLTFGSLNAIDLTKVLNEAIFSAKLGAHFLEELKKLSIRGSGFIFFGSWCFLNIIIVFGSVEDFWRLGPFSLVVGVFRRTPGSLLLLGGSHWLVWMDCMDGLYGWIVGWIVYVRL